MTFDPWRCTFVVLSASEAFLAGAVIVAALLGRITAVPGTISTPRIAARPPRAGKWPAKLPRTFPRLLLIVATATAFALGCRSESAPEPQSATLMQLSQATEPREIERLVSALNPTDREQLRQRQRQFDSLDVRQQQKLREIHQRLCRSDSGEVYGTLYRYCEWLATLPDGERADLLELPADERIERIKQRQRDLTYTPFDVMRVVMEWLSQYAQQHEREFQRQLPVEVRDRLDRMPPARDRFRIYMLLREVARQRDKIEFPPASSGEIEQLVAQLPEDSLTHFSTRVDFSNPAAVPRQLLELIDSNMKRRFRAVDEDRLKKFYESDALTTQQRDQLDRLPPEDARQQLQELMLLSRLDEMQRDRRRGLDRPPRGGGPFGRRGRPPMGPGAPGDRRRPFPPPDHPPDPPPEQAGPQRETHHSW